MACYKRSRDGGGVREINKRRFFHFGPSLARNSMSAVTLEVIDGANRGQLFEELTPPVTIGREEGNTIQLNDERISRFHIKIQEDDNRLVLTDLDSTNGTKVNGEEMQIRILRYGDMITVGRSVLRFGSREQIAERLASLRAGDATDSRTIGEQDSPSSGKAGSLDFELNWNDDGTAQTTLHALSPPELPSKLSPGQAAQLFELLEYLHIRIRHLLGTAKEDDGERISLEQRRWQNLLELQASLAEYQRKIGEPRE